MNYLLALYRVDGKDSSEGLDSSLHSKAHACTRMTQIILSMPTVTVKSYKLLSLPTMFTDIMTWSAHYMQLLYLLTS